MSTRWVAVVGGVLTVVGAACAGWGLVYLAGALSPENAGNELREIGVAVGIGAVVVGALPAVAGILLMVSASRRRRRERSAGTVRSS
ncbi:hypothetical protein [Terracoccus sp. 273MFTsu3.1]|uniref:hypothetical protein n=1 Tax=Terracoccus sp. 273MFTsu3.1 TaxID=1172188 RepID=UPI00037F7430|nr:hypothetical protein [Terracoccus sp. 273MFTsu3.1]